jgi:hypothetical protein
MIKRIYENLGSGFIHQNLTMTAIITLMFIVCVLAIYEFIVYRFISKKSLYNREFGLCIVILPFFISTIILTLQSNLVITLGTIGALAIIRFRTAVKDPVDMIYLLWSIHIGITCGCSLYEVAVVTSLIVTIILFVMNKATLADNQMLLVFHTDSLDAEDSIITAVKEFAPRCRIKSRNVTKSGVDYVLELKVKRDRDLSVRLGQLETIREFSLVSYNS